MASSNFLLLKKKINNDNLWSTEIQESLKKLSYAEREQLALETKTRNIYYGDEVTDVIKKENNILNLVLPDGITIKDLHKINCLNIGAGGRTIHDTLISVDINRGTIENNNKHNGFTKNSVLSSANNLLFKNDSIDCIIALHIFEHVQEPVHTLKEWLRVLKPGGKLGVVIPDWRYNWDASTDNHVNGHRWNTTPLIVKKMLETHFKEYKILYFNTYSYKQSFDFVLQKPGIYTHVSIKDELTGMQLGKKISKDYYIYNGIVIC